MASGEKLPNTNLNLIQDSDLIDHEDINAIAQEVDANSANIGLLATSVGSNSSNISSLTTTVTANQAFINSLYRPVKSGDNVNIQHTDDMRRLFVQPMYQGLNVPTNDLGVLIHIPYSKDWVCQIWIDIRGTRRFSRYFTGGTTWSTWTQD